jgi:hypothetical protein
LGSAATAFFTADELCVIGVRADDARGSKSITRHTPHSQNEGDYERKLMAGMARQMSTSSRDCAIEIITGLEARKKRLVVGNGARTLHRISRLFPDSYGALLRRKLEAYRTTSYRKGYRYGLRF